MPKNTTASKKAKAMKKVIEKKEVKTLDEIQEEKHAQDEMNQEKPIENGTGIVIVLSGDILIGGYLYKKQIAYKVNKEQFLLLEHHAKILGVAIRLN